MDLETGKLQGSISRRGMLQYKKFCPLAGNFDNKPWMKSVTYLVESFLSGTNTCNMPTPYLTKMCFSELELCP